MNKFQGESVGDLFIDIKARQDEFNRQLKRLRSNGEKTAKKIEKDFSKLKSLGNNFKNFAIGGGVLAGIVGLTSKVKELTAAAFQQAKAEAAVKQAIKSTGGVAGVSLRQLKDYASELQRLTGIGDEVQLKDVSAQLLSFTNIRTPDIFKRTQAAVLDLSEALGSNLRSQSIQLGKALNDPVLGLSALARSGIQFTEQQKGLIKSLVESGNMFQAQTLILDELESQYGGQAEAAAKAEGGTRQFTAAVGDLGEVIGSGLVKVLTPVVGLLNKWLGASADAVTNTQAVTRSAAGQVEQFDKLAFTYDQLAKNTNRTASEQKLYTSTIADLQKLYPNYLKNIDLETGRYEDVSKALKEARKDLRAFLEQKVKLAVVQDLETEFVSLGKQLDNLAQKRIDVQRQLTQTKELTAEALKTQGREALPPDVIEQAISSGLNEQVAVIDRLEKEIAVRQGEIQRRIEETQKSLNFTLQAPTPEAAQPTVTRSSTPSSIGDIPGIEVRRESANEYLNLVKELDEEELKSFEGKEEFKRLTFEETLRIMEEQQSNFNEILLDGANVFSDSFGDALQGMLFDQQKFGDAIKQVWQDIARSVVDEIGKMIAKWLAFQAIKAAASFIPGVGGVVAAAGGSVPTAQHGGNFIGTSSGVKKMANGGSFIVPNGFPNDSFPLLVESGERVNVTPAGMVNLENDTLQRMDGKLAALINNVVMQNSRMQTIEGRIELGSTIEGRDIELSGARQQRLTTRLK